MSTITKPRKLTPMMEQYRSVKKTLSEDTVLFFRLGDFYEMFFQDAVRASEILDITLTGRDAGEAGRVPMCGIPYHAFHGYVRTLLDHNLKVAVCEQVSDPKASKGLVERKVTRIITPATYLDEESSPMRNEYMAAVVSDDPAKLLGSPQAKAAVACLEISTGEFSIREVSGERLLSELALLSPREVILPQDLAGQEPLHSFIKDVLGASLTSYESWVFDYEQAAGCFKEAFKLTSSRSLAFWENKLAVRSGGALLYYLRANLQESLEHVRIPKVLQADEFMVLDRQTQKNLELVENLKMKEEGKGAAGRAPTLISCLDQTLTTMGSRTLYGWVTRPLLSPAAIRERLDAVEVLIRKTDTLHQLREVLRGVRDMERTLSRLNYGVANARDLVNLKHFLEKVPLMKQTLSVFTGGKIAALAGGLEPQDELVALIGCAIIEEPPLALKDGGLVRAGYSAELDELRGISKNGKKWILEFEKREAERTGIRSLKIKYSGVFGYTIEISKANLASVPEDYHRRQTLANAERFVVPELKAWDEKISGAQDKIKNLEYEIFNQVRCRILERLKPLQETARRAGTLDALASLAVTALAKQWVRPEVTADRCLTIKGGRHPVVEAMIPAGRFVENDTAMDGEGSQLLVLTGPNMAGKSTYIRQVAQIVLLAQIGSFVPAKSAKIGLVDRIFTRIGAADDLARGESTFMVEMLETAQILQSATDRSLLILDEVGRGTSTFDGVSIAWAICEHLAGGKVRPRTLFATHYHELTQLEGHFPSVKNYTITVKESPEGIVFLRRVVRGATDRSYGIHVARLAGIPREITGRAEEILKVLESENTQATDIIEHKKERLTPGRVPDQPTLFDTVAEHPVVQNLRELKIESLTPLDALNRLAQLKKDAAD